MTKIQITPVRPVYPSPAALVTSCDRDGRPNIITLGEAFNLSISKPVIVGIAIAPARYSHALISETREFVLNLPTVDILKETDAVGSISGRKADKFAMTGLTPLPAAKVRPPLIAECPVNIECKVIDIQTIGDHDLFQGEVVAQHVDEAALGADGKVDPTQLRTFAFQGWQYFAVTDLLGARGVGRELLPRK